jgi:predicted TIM-barrel fold metal-dependent hydrolase
MRIDHHNHIWAGSAAGESFLDQPMSVESILRAMDAGAVDAAGVCALAQDMQNDYVLEAQRKFPDRIFGYCFIHPRDNNAVETLRRYLGEGLKGLKLHPRLHGYPLYNHSLVDPLLEVCREFGVPAFSHGGSEEFNMPFDFEELARTFPDVPIILGHMGAYGAVDAAILAASRTPNLYLDTSLCSLSDLKAAIRIAGADKLLMSTDWPGSDFRIENLKLELATEGSPEARRKIAGENYAQLAGMKR